MQSLAEVEPVVIDASFECAYGFSVQAEKPSGFAPLLDSGTAETFQTAMSDDFIATPNFRRMVLTRDSSKKIDRTAEDLPVAVGRKGEDSPTMIGCVVLNAPEMDGGDLRRLEDKPPYRSVHVVEDMPKSVERTVKNMPGCMVSAVNDLPDMPVRVAEDLPEKKVHIVEDVSREPVRVAGNPFKPTNHAYFNGQEMEQVQIIAPAPLPIELPTSAVPQQSPISIATSEIAQVFVAVAEAVADAILVSSGFSDGEGSIIVRLQPEVLSGSEVRLVAKDGVLTVVVDAVTDDVQKIVETNRVQFEQHIAEKVHSWRISVAVRRGGKSDERI